MIYLLSAIGFAVTASCWRKNDALDLVVVVFMSGLMVVNAALSAPFVMGLLQ